MYNKLYILHILYTCIYKKIYEQEESNDFLFDCSIRIRYIFVLFKNNVNARIKLKRQQSI